MISKSTSLYCYNLHRTMPQPARQARPNTRAMTSNPTPGTRPPSSTRSESRQRSHEAGNPFDFMAKVPSPVIPPPPAPEVSAARPVDAVCINIISVILSTHACLHHFRIDHRLHPSTHRPRSRTGRARRSCLYVHH